MNLPFILANLLAAVLLCTGCQRQSSPENAVNSVIGDVSYVRQFGVEPGADSDEQTRITAHLQYVEELLRRKETRALPNHLRRRRYHALNLLRKYWQAGVYPRNYDYPNERRPCFIDRDGRICAVGYLVEQTAGRAVAEKINGQHQYDLIQNMRTPELQAWVKTSGLTLEECAMIQPSYWGPGFPPTANNNHVEPLYGAGTAVWSGLNVPLAAMNVVRVAQGERSKTLGVVGLLSGAGQVALGALTLPNEKKFNAPPRNESRKAVSYLNIGLGTTTMVMSAWNLVANRPVQTWRTAVGVQAVPVPGQQPGYALSLTRRL